MNYLTTYKLFESSDGLDKESIKDIFFSCYEDLFDNFYSTVDTSAIRMEFMGNNPRMLSEEVKDNTLYVEVSMCFSRAGGMKNEPALQMALYTSFNTRFLGARKANPFSMESLERRSKFLEPFINRIKPHQLFIEGMRTMDLYYRVDGQPENIYKSQMREQILIIK